MANQELLDYINIQLKAGMAKEQIRKFLSIQGWNEQEIADAFSIVQTPSATLSPISSAMEAPAQPVIPRKRKWPRVIGLLFLFLIIGAGAWSYYVKSTRPGLFGAATSATEAENEEQCDPNNPEVTENVKLVGPYEKKTMSTEGETFQVIEAVGANKEWIHEDAWQVCGQLAIPIGHFGNEKKVDDHIYYNGNLYAVPAGARPLTGIHDQIAYKTDYEGTGVVHGKTYDFTDPQEKVYSVNGKVAFVQVSERKGPGGLPSKVKVFWGDDLLGEYERIFGGIHSIGGEPTFFTASFGEGNEMQMYPRTVIVQGGRIISDASSYVGVPNAWDGTLGAYKGKPAYVVLSGPQFSVGQYVPHYNENVKYVVVWDGKVISDSYDLISRLVVIRDTLGIEGIKNGTPTLTFGGKDYGSTYESAGFLMDAGGTIAFLGTLGTGDGNKLTFDVVFGDDVLATLSNPYVFYPERDLTFVGKKVAMVVRAKDVTSGFVQYAEKQIFKGYSVKSVLALGNKLVVAANDGNNDFYFIEQ